MLGSALFNSEIGSEFFRLLCGANARIYIDALDALARETGETTLGLSRQEAVEVVAQAVERHAGLRLDEGELLPVSEDVSSPIGQANFLLNRMIAARWLSEPQRPDYQRIVFLERQGEILLDALRRMAAPETAQFTDKLLLVCTTLSNPEAFLENPWGDLEGCIANAKLGLQELRGMQKSVERMTKRQLEAQTLRENLSVLYDEFSETIGHSCYRELVRVRLPIRLKQSHKRLEELEMDTAALEKMQGELMRRDAGADAASAMSRVRLRIHELFQLLEAIEPQAEMIDQRAAEFARRSFARFRYLQEIGSARREQVQAVFENINTRFAKMRLSEIEEETHIPRILLGEARLIGGLESLFIPRHRRTAEEAQPIDADPDAEDIEACILEMEGNLRDSLTVLRANRFIESLDFGDSKILASTDLPIRTDDDVADLASVLLHAESSDAGYKLHTQREKGEFDMAKTDEKAGYLIEQFELERK